MKRKKSEVTLHNLSEGKSIQSVLGADSNKISSIGQAAKLVNKVQVVMDERTEQLKIKQIMNLQAKGFFLDNAEDMCKSERKETEIKRRKVREMRKRTTKLLSVINGSDENASSKARHQLMLDASQKDMPSLHSEEFKSLQILKSKKLRSLQTLLTDNANREFEKFQEEFSEIKRVSRKNELLTDRMNKEDMYFIPILNPLGQFRLAR